MAGNAGCHRRWLARGYDVAMGGDVMTAGIDLSGRKMGRLTVLRLAPKMGSRGRWWLCRCECGKLKEISATHLLHGGTSSCGCYKRERGIEAARKRASPALDRFMGNLVKSVNG